MIMPEERMSTSMSVSQKIKDLKSLDMLERCTY